MQMHNSKFLGKKKRKRKEKQEIKVTFIEDLWKEHEML